MMTRRQSCSPSSAGRAGPGHLRGRDRLAFVFRCQSHAGFTYREAHSGVRKVIIMAGEEFSPER